MRPERRQTEELLAAIGGWILLAAIAAPIDWFEEVPTGGFTGDGGGIEPRAVTALDEFGLWLAPVIAGALAPTADLLLRRRQQGLPPLFLLGIVAVGAAVLLAGVLSEALYEVPPCCDMAYFIPEPRAGLVPAAVGAAMLAIGTTVAVSLELAATGRAS